MAFKNVSREYGVPLSDVNARPQTFLQTYIFTFSFFTVHVKSLILRSVGYFLQ